MKRRSIGIPLVASTFALVLGAACGSSDCEDDLCFSGEGGAAGAAGATGEGGAQATTGGVSTGGTASGGMTGTGGATAQGGGAGVPTEAGNSSGGADGGQDGEGGTTDGGGQAGQGGSGGEQEPPCDGSKSPLEDACVVQDLYAVFVDPDGGIDSATGTKEDPVATLEKAVELATESDRRVIACTGTYTETLSLTGDLALEIYGGFDCDNDWVHTDERSIVAPEAESGVALSGVALMANAVEGSVLIDGVEFRAPDADPSEPGASSIGAMVVASEGITLRNVRIVAGVGADGASGEDGIYEGLGEPAATGNSAVGEDGASALECTLCPAGEASIGGRGGDGGVSPGGGGAGSPDYGGGGGGDGVAKGDSCNPDGFGGDGNPAPATDDGLGASSLGTLSASGWISAGGDAGSDGKVGQGGGGGGGGEKGGGGGGGCGGCGGKGGAAGDGGGASIGLVVIDSEVALEAVEIVSDSAGDGGSGHAGQEGQEGGPGGTQATTGCQGGIGGPGAQGGAGGGGAGGLSVGILWSGVEPSVAEDVVIEPGEAGDAGLGGELGVNDGTPGDSLDIRNADEL